MKNQTSLKWDVEKLVKDVTVQEAHLAVEQKLERALDSLEPRSREVLMAYFNGTSLEQLSKDNSISLKETQNWVQQIKRQLISQLQRNNSARH